MKYNRINEIEQYLRKAKSATNEELLETFKISIQTLRRDLKELEERNVISKLYGGVVYNEDAMSSSFVDIKLRTTAHLKEKEKIGELAASLLEDNDIIFVDSGTTTCHLIPYLDKAQNITVVTNSMIAMELLRDCENVKVVLLGGEYKFRARSTIFDVLQAHYYFTKAFISTVGLSLTKGLTNMDPQDGILKRFVSDHADKVILMCDSSKVGSVAFNQFGDLDMIHTLVTDKKLDAKYLSYFKKHRIKVIYPDNL